MPDQSHRGSSMSSQNKQGKDLCDQQYESSYNSHSLDGFPHSENEGISSDDDLSLTINKEFSGT